MLIKNADTPKLYVSQEKMESPFYAIPLGPKKNFIFISLTPLENYKKEKFTVKSSFPAPPRKMAWQL